MSEYKIDNKVPIPASTAGQKAKYPWASMKVGDSIFIEKVYTSLAGTARCWALRQKNGWEFASRTAVENKKKGIRIWRTK